MTTFYDRVGGSATFEDLVSHFYALVSVDPILRPLYPESDLKAAAQRLQMFLEQYWGGPSTYSDQRGHPRQDFILLLLSEMHGCRACKRQLTV